MIIQYIQQYKAIISLLLVLPMSLPSWAVQQGPSAAAEAYSAQPVRGVIRSINQATLSAGITAQIEKIPFREGMAFKKGDTLVFFDCRKPKADVRAAQQARNVKKSRVDANNELQQFQSIGQLEVIASEAEYQQAVAEVESLQTQVSQCRIKAPFNGTVRQQIAQQFETVGTGDEILAVVDTDNIEVDLIIPSQWLVRIGKGSQFNFKVDETGQTLKGQLLRISPSIDPVSKTVKVIGELSKTDDGLIIPGMSGSALFTAETAEK
jgi:membrane fusion protein (multidrug efflux system)